MSIGGPKAHVTLGMIGSKSSRDAKDLWSFVVHGGMAASHKRAMIASQGQALRAHGRRELEAFLEVLQLGPYRCRLFQAAAYGARCLKTVTGNHQHR